MSTLTKTVQIISITSALVGSGAIWGLSVFQLPTLKAQPAERSLPSIRWFFSRGSHTIPVSILTSTAGFLYLAYDALPSNLRSLSQLFKTTHGMKVNGYFTAAFLSFSIALYTSQFMIANNFAIIKKNEEKGGARSQASAKAAREQGYKPGERSAEDSVNSKGEANQWTDTSGPMEKTADSFSEAEEREVWEMLDKFQKHNLVRASGIGLGGIVGLLTALS